MKRSLKGHAGFGFRISGKLILKNATGGIITSNIWLLLCKNL